MKEKVKRFFVEKKELLIFIGVVVFVFAAVIGIASLALHSSEGGKTDTPANVTPSDNTDDKKDDNQTSTDDGNKTTPVVTEKFSLPIIGEYELVRTYFDEALADEELESAIIINGSCMTTSTGVGYAKKDNSEFDVLAIYSGKVISVTQDELAGSTVVIEHDNQITSTYSSLTDVKVSVGDSVKQGMTIAKASTSILDTEAGVHVFLEVKVSDKYVNPVSIVGKEITEVVETK